MRCFYSHSFRQEDKSVVEWFREFLEAFPGIELVEVGDENRPPLDQVERAIAGSELFCTVITQRNGAIPQWISTEIGLARQHGLEIFAFVEEGISDLGCLPAICGYQTFQRRPLGRRAPAYVRYVNSLRGTVLRRHGEDRASLLERVRTLSSQVQRMVDDEDAYNESFVR